MRVFFIFIVICVLLSMTVPITFAVRFWMDGQSVLTQAQRSGTLRAPRERGPLTGVERTIAMSEFRSTWRTQGTPCRTLMLLWADLTTDSAPRGMPVSQRVATTLLGEENGTSVRWQVRRLIVACQLEQRFDDPRLLRLWLAGAYFGRGETGIETASQSIFGKPSRNLNAEESVRLAVLLRGNPERWDERTRQLQERLAAIPH